MFLLDTYPGGGTPPSSVVDHGSTAVHHAASHAATLPFTGGDAVALVVIALVLLFIGLALRGVSNFGRSEH